MTIDTLVSVGAALETRLRVRPSYGTAFQAGPFATVAGGRA
jgi:hypothetical protein